MVRADRIAITAVGLLGRAAVGFLGLVVVLGTITPPPEPDTRARFEPDAPGCPTDRVVLTVPEGRLLANLIVVDASGREIATVTRCFNGDLAMVANRAVGASVSSYLHAKGPAVLVVTGSARRARIEAEPDGTTKTSASDVPPVLEPPALFPPCDHPAGDQERPGGDQAR
jgi:hypothetical protein